MKHIRQSLDDLITLDREETQRREEQEKDMNKAPTAYSLLCCQLVEKAIHQRDRSVDDPDGPENLNEKYDFEKLYEELLTLNRYDKQREEREDLYAVCLLALRVIIGRCLEEFDRMYLRTKLGLNMEFPAYDW